jgi:hypothetical protein
VDENKFEIDSEGDYVDQYSGEKIDPEDLMNAHYKKAKENLAQAAEIARLSNIPFSTRLVKHKNVEYHVAAVKPKFKFNKIFESSMKDLFEDKNLDVYSLAFLGRFTPYIVFPQNYLVLENEFPTIEKIGEILKIKRQKVNEILKELEYLEIIKRVKRGRNNIIFFNPFLYASGLDIEIATIQLFENSLFSTKF